MKLTPLYRLTPPEVVSVANKHEGHWQNLEDQTGAPFITASGFSLSDLSARLTLWQDLNHKIETGGHDELEQLYRQRDAFWGLNASDDAGAHYWLSLYKKGAQGRLARAGNTPTVSALKMTIPNIGNPQPVTIPALFENFGEHWGKVNAVLAAQTPPQPPLVLGADFDIAALQSAASGWNDKQAEIRRTQGEVPQWRAERDVVLGDFGEDERDPDSLISMLYDYHFSVETQKPGSTYADTLPRIFPSQPSDKEPPKFAYNYQAGPDDIGVEVWFQVELGSLATLLFLKEGDFEEVKPIAEGAGCKRISFENVHISDGIDRLEWRDDENRIIGIGKFDADFDCV